MTGDFSVQTNRNELSRFIGDSRPVERLTAHQTGCLGAGVSWFDVLIKMKNIFWIVASLDLYQAIIVRAVSRGDPVALFFGHEIYVSAGGRVRRAGVKKSARPLDANRILRRAVPSSVHIQDELGVPVRVSYRRTDWLRK